MSDEGTIGGEPVRIQFPVRVVLFGVSVVIISEAEYSALTGLDRDTSPVSRLSRLDKEPEVRAFIQERLGTDDVDRIREAAIDRFGADRVPSRSALNRFVKRGRAKRGRPAVG